MLDYLNKLLALADLVGTVSRVSLYNEYATISGEMDNGKKFTLSLDIMEAKENDTV